MASRILPPSLLDFLSGKKPQVWARSWGGDRSIELTLGSDRELDSQVGVLRLEQPIAQDVDEADALCAVTLATLSDLSQEQRMRLDKTRPCDAAVVCLFAAPNGKRYFSVSQGIEFSLKSWIDFTLTERVRNMNAEAGFTAGRAVQSHFATSNVELVGREVVCWGCLRRLLVEKEFMDCPHCKETVGPTSPEQLLRSFFHTFTGNERLYEQSGCGLLQAKTGILESYRLIFFSYWLHHQIIAVDRTTDSARIAAKAWNHRVKVWFPTVDRALTPAEWRRFGQLLQAAPFWELPPRGGHFGYDGADYTLEGFKDGSYHFVSRWSPSPATDEENFAYPCGYLMELSRSEPPRQ